MIQSPTPGLLQKDLNQALVRISIDLEKTRGLYQKNLPFLRLADVKGKLCGTVSAIDKYAGPHLRANWFLKGDPHS